MGKKKWNIFLALLMIVTLFPVRSYMTQAETVNDNGVSLSKEAKRVEGKLNQWEVNLKVEIEPEQETTDIVFVYDISSSMLSHGREEAAKKAAKNFAKNIKSSKVRLGLVTFGTEAKRVHGFTSDRNKFINSIDNIKITSKDTGGEEQFTFTTGGLQKAEELMKTSTAKHKKIIFLSDGAPNVVHKLKPSVADKLFSQNRTATVHKDFKNENGYRYHSKYTILRDPSLILKLDPLTSFSNTVTTVANQSSFVGTHWNHYPDSGPTNYLNASWLFDQKSERKGTESYWKKKTSGGKEYSYREWYQALPSSEVTMLYGDKVKASLPDVDIYSVGLMAGDEGQRVLDYLATSSRHSFAATSENIDKILEAVSNKIAVSIDDAKISDPMGDGFKLIGKPTVVMGNGKTLQYDSNKIDWGIPEDGFTYDKVSGKYVAHIKYIVEADEDTIKHLEEGTTSLNTNGDAKFSYKKKGKPNEKEFPKPQAKPSVLKVTKELYDEEGNLVSLEDDKNQRKYHYHLDLGEKENQTFEGVLTHGAEHLYHLYQTEEEVYLYEENIENDDLDRFDVKYFFEGENGEYEELKIDDQGRAIFKLKPESGMNHFIIKNFPKKDYRYEDYKIEKSVIDANENGVAEIGETLTYTVDVTNTKDAFIREVEIQDKLENILDYVENHDANKIVAKRNGKIVEESWTVKDLKEGIHTHLDKNETLSLSFDVKVIEEKDTLTDVEELVNTARVNEKEADSKIKVVLPKYKASKTVEDGNRNGYAEAGERLDYTITVENTGEVRVPNLKVQDSLDGILEYLQEDEFEKAMVSYQDQQVPLKTMVEEGFVIENIAVDEIVDITFSVYLKEEFDVDEIKVLENIATVGEEKPKTEIKTAKPIISSQKEVELVEGKAYVEAGDEITYRIKIKNDGKVAKSDTLVRDDLSEIIDYLEESQFDKDNLVKVLSAEGKVLQETSLNTLGKGFEIEVPAESSVSVEFRVKFKDDLSDLEDGTKITNIATVSTENPNKPNKPDEPTVTVPFGKPVIVSNKVLHEEFEDGIIEPGEKIAYTITIENKGTALKQNLFIQDDMTALQELMDSSTPYSDLKFSLEKNGTIEYHPIKKLHQGFTEDLDFEDKITIYFEFKVREDLDVEKVQEIENIAVIGEDTPKVTTPTGKPNLITAKEVQDENENGYAEAGERLDYILTLENTGTVTKRDVLIQDTLDNVLPHIQEENLEFTMNGENYPIQKLQDGFEVDIQAGEKIEVRFSVTMSEDLDTDEVSSILNQATLGDDVPKVEIPTGRPKIIAEKSVTDENGNDFAEAGEKLTYKLQIENIGEVSQEGVLIQDSLKEMTDYLDISKENTFSLNGENYPLSQLINGFERTIDAGEKVEIVFTVQVRDDFDADEVAHLVNIAKVDEETPKTDIRTGKPRITIDKTVKDENKDGRAEVGETLSYEIVVSNKGEVKKDKVFIQDNLLELKNYVADLNDTVFTIDTVEKPIQELMDGFEIPLDAGQTVRINFDLVISEAMDAEKVERLINIATADEEEVEVEIPTGKAKIVAKKSVIDDNGDQYAEPGEKLQYKIHIKNDGTVAKKDLFVQDDLSELSDYVEYDPASLVFISGQSYQLQELIEGIYIDLDAGAQVEVNFEVKVKENLDLEEGTQLVNIATVGPEKPSVEIPFGKPNIRIDKFVEDQNKDGYAEAGEPLHYKIVVQNTGKVAKKQVHIQDTLEDVKDYFVDVDKVKMTMNGEVYPLTKLMNGFTHDFDSGEKLTLEFKVQLIENLDVDEISSLVNIAIADDEEDDAKVKTGEPVIVAHKFVEDVNEVNASASDNQYAEAGETLKYKLLVHNKGDVAKKDIFIKDDFSKMKEWIDIDETSPVSIEKFDSNDGKIGTEMKTMKDLLNGFVMDMPLGAGETVEITFSVKVKEILTAEIGEKMINKAQVGPERPQVEIPAGKPEIYGDKKAEKVGESLSDQYFVAGETLKYTIMVGNSGNVEAEKVLVKDNLGDIEAFIQGELSEISVLKNGQESPYSLKDFKEGIYVNLEAEEEVLFSFEVTLDGFDADDQTTLTNIAVIGDIPEKPSVTVPTGKPKISAIKKVSDENKNGYAEAGEQLDYLLIVTNTGEVKKKDLLVKDTMENLKPYVEPVGSVSVESSREDVSSKEFSLESLMTEGIRVDVAPAEQLTFKFSVKVKDNFDADAMQSLANIAVIGEKVPEKPWEDEPITPETEIPTGKPRIEAKKYVQEGIEDGYAEAGEQLTYTIEVFNRGEVADNKLFIQDNLTDLKDLLETVENIPLKGDVEGKTLEDLMNGFDISLASGEKKVISFTVTVSKGYDPDDYDKLVNMATVGPETPTTETPGGKAIIKSWKDVEESIKDGYVEAGEALTYTITVHNYGNVAKRDLKIQDNLEDIRDHIQSIDELEYEVVSNKLDKEAIHSQGPLSELVNDGIQLDVKPGETLSIRFTVTALEDLDTDSVKAFANLATVGEETPGTKTPTGKPNIIATKEVKDANGNGYAEAGERLDYRIVIKNTGEVAKRKLWVQDELKDLLPHIKSIKKVELKGVEGKNLQDLVNGFEIDLDAKETITLSFSVVVKDDFDADQVKVLSNLATIGEDKPITPETDIPTAKPKIHAKKEVFDENGDGYAEAGEKLTYRITITNKGLVAKENLFVKDELSKLKEHIVDTDVEIKNAPEGIKLSNLMQGFYMDVDAQESIVLEFTVQVKDDFDADKTAELINLAVIGEEEPEKPTVTIPTGKPVIKAEKKVFDENGDGFVEAGERLDYTITIRNEGKVAKKDLFVQDDLKDIIEHIQPIDEIVLTGDVEDKKLLDLVEGFTIDIDANKTKEIKFSVIVQDEFKADEIQTLANQATVGPEKPEVTVPSGRPIIEAKKFVKDETGDGKVEAGEKLHYRIRITNKGNVTKRNLLVQDDLKDLMPYIESVDVPVLGTPQKIRLHDLVEGIRIDVPAESEIDLEFTVQVRKDLNVEEVKELINIASIGEDEPITPEVKIPTGKPIIKAEKSVVDETGDKKAEAGEHLTYTIRMTNEGNVVKRDLLVKDDLKDLMPHIESIEGIKLEGDVEDRLLTDLVEGFTIDLDAKESIEMTFTVQVREDFDSDEHPELINIASIGEDEPITPEVEIPTGKPVIEAEKLLEDENGDGYAEAGEKLTYTLKIHNRGEVAKKGLLVKDDLKDLMPHIESIEGIKLEGDVEDRLLTDLVEGFTIDLDAKESVEMTFTVQVREDFDSEEHPKLINIASIGEDEPITPEVEIPTGKPVIEAEKLLEDENGDGYAEAGEKLTYTLRVHNRGEVAKKGLLVKDDLKDLMPHIESIEGIKLEGDVEDRLLTDLVEGFTIDLDAKESIEMTFTVQVREDFDSEEHPKLINIASIGEDEPITPEVEIPTGKPVIEAEKLLEDENGDGYAEAGEKLTYTLRVHNRGEVAKKDLLVKDDLKDLMPHIESIEGIKLEGDVEDRLLTDLVEGFTIDLDAKESVEMTFTVQVKEEFNSDEHPKLINIASIGEDEPITPEVEVPTGKADIISWKFVEDANKDRYAEPGEILTYTIRIHNQGEVAQKNLFVQDDLENLKDHLVLTEGAEVNVNGELRLLEELIKGFELDIQAGETIDIVFDVKVKEDLDSELIDEFVNIATVGEDTPSVKIPTGQPDLKITKKVFDENENGYAEAGERLDYVITVENQGDVAKRDVRIQDSLSEMMAYLQNTDVVHVEMGEESFALSKLQEGIYIDLDAKEKIELKFSVYLKDSLNVKQVSEISNTVYVDDIPTTERIPVGSPKILIDKSVVDENRDGYASGGEKLNYTIKVQNVGQVAKQVFVKDDLGSLRDHIHSFAFTKMDVNGEKVSLRKLIKGFEFDLGAGETLTISFTVTVKEDVSVESLYNIAYADEASDDVTVPVSMPEKPTIEDPLKPWMPSPSAPLPPTGKDNHIYLISLGLLFVGIILAGRGKDEE